MKSKSVVFYLVFILLGVFLSGRAQAANSLKTVEKVESPHEKLLREYREKMGIKTETEKAAEKPKSIWDDDSAANPYFKSSSKKASVKTTKKEIKKTKEPKRSTFKRRVYTGPSKEEINEAASQKAVENFKVYLASKDYDVKFGKISYNVAADSLSVTDFMMVPKKGSPQEEKIPYYLTAKELIFRKFNIGEKNAKPVLENGEMKARKVEIPVWDENNVKKGKVEIAQLIMRGNVPAYMKAQGEGKLSAVELRDFRSETIINETILNNVVRSKIFSASSAAFTGVDLKKELIDSIKHQSLDGLKFETARIDSRNIPSLSGAIAAMTSYSARILNTDLVLGARLEAQKDKPVADMEQLKKNAEENKAAIVAVEAEMKSK